MNIYCKTFIGGLVNTYSKAQGLCCLHLMAVSYGRSIVNWHVRSTHALGKNICYGHCCKLRLFKMFITLAAFLN